MLAIAKERPGPGIRFDADLPVPVPRPGEALLRPLLVGVCGTDLHIEAWGRSYRDLENHLPTVLGHEVLAEVLEAESFSIGEHVVAISVYGCGGCNLCRSGSPQLCPDARENSLGMARNGGLSELMALPEERLLAVPEGVPEEVAALCEPFAAAVRAVSGVASERLGRVAVLGPGTIGLMVAAVAMLWEPEQLVVAGIESDAVRLELAERMGLEGVILSGREDAEELTNALGGPVDVVFEAAGSPRAVWGGLETLAPGGELVVVGIPGEPLAVEFGGVVRREIQMRGSYAAGPGDWERALEIMRNKQADLRPLVGPVFELSEARCAFQATREGIAGRALVRCQG